MDVSEITTWAQVAADIVLVISVSLFAYNLWATRRDIRRNLIFSMMEQLTSAGFADRRWKLHRTVEVASANGWKGFDDSREDFESRSFAYRYELIGQLGTDGTLEYELMRDFLQYSVGVDWNAFQPLHAHLIELHPGHTSPWSRFQQLAVRINTDLRGTGVRGAR